MMKFFALVALAVFATASAQSTVAEVTATRNSLVAGAAGGSLVLTVKASASGNIAGGGTITAVLTGGDIFSGAGATACTATAATAAGVAVTNAPAFTNAGTPDECVVSARSATGATLTCTMGGTGDDILAVNNVMTITCTDNMVTNNIATATAYTFSVTTSGDDTAATGSYTLKTTATTFTASRGSAATNLMTGVPGGSLTFAFTPATTLPADGTITLTPRNDADNAGVDIFTASSATSGQTGATTCTATVADVASGTAQPTFASAIVSGAAGSQILTLTLNSASTDTVLATKAATIVCTDNLAVNPAAGNIKFNLVTSSDANAMGAQTGYTVAARTCPLWTSGVRPTLTTGVAGGDLTVIFTTTAALPATETITLTSSAKIFTADDASTTCSVAVGGGNTPPTATTAVTATGTVLTLTTVGQQIAANTQVTLVCSTNLDVNGAVGDSITFSIATQQDSTTLAAQTGYGPFTAATSAASSTASVSMLTMLALAAVAMRQ